MIHNTYLIGLNNVPLQRRLGLTSLFSAWNNQKGLKKGDHF